MIHVTSKITYLIKAMWDTCLLRSCNIEDIPRKVYRELGRTDMYYLGQKVPTTCVCIRVEVIINYI
jgi:hypothetical protein